MKFIFTLIFVPMLLCGVVCADDEAKLPVFYLKYDSSLVSEETEEDVEQSAVRHTVSLRIKEQFSRVLTTNLLTSFSRKQYRLEKGSYSYVTVNPYVSWDVTDKVRIFQGFRSRWICYDELDSEGLSKDFTSLLFDPKDTAESAELKIDGVAKKTETAAGSESCEFTGVKLPTGDTRLEAVLSHGNKSRGVYQVVVTRCN